MLLRSAFLSSKKPLLSFAQRFNFVMASSNASVHSGDLSIAYVTTPSEEVAIRIAHGLLSQKLAACVNIVPRVTSVYFWEGKVNEDNEAMMIIKTQTSKIDEVSAHVQKNHPYSVCEVISVKIDNGNEPFLQWISDNLA